MVLIKYDIWKMCDSALVAFKCDRNLAYAVYERYETIKANQPNGKKTKKKKKTYTNTHRLIEHHGRSSNWTFI